MASLEFLALCIGLGLKSLFYGLCVTSLWEWYLIPLGVPAISYWQAVGLVLFKMIIIDSTLAVPAKADEVNPIIITMSQCILVVILMIFAYLIKYFS